MCRRHTCPINCSAAPFPSVLPQLLLDPFPSVLPQLLLRPFPSFLPQLLLGPFPSVFPAQGHAFEARVYAESPAAGFLPAGGTVLRWHTPPGAVFFRWVLGWTWVGPGVGAV